VQAACTLPPPLPWAAAPHIVSLTLSGGRRGKGGGEGGGEGGGQGGGSKANPVPEGNNHEHNHENNRKNDLEEGQTNEGESAATEPMAEADGEMDDRDLPMVGGTDGRDGDLHAYTRGMNDAPDEAEQYGMEYDDVSSNADSHRSLVRSETYLCRVNTVSARQLVGFYHLHLLLSLGVWSTFNPIPLTLKP
jgi:hypothetical protein